jgi:hypothetical protein
LRAASVVVISPASERRMFTSPVAPMAFSSFWRPSMYVATLGRTYEFMQAVRVRSYSRNSGSTCAESVTGKPG